MERTLDDQVRPEDTHGGNTNTGLCGTVGGTEAGEDDGGHASHRSKERLLQSQHLFHVLLRLTTRLPPAYLLGNYLYIS